MTIGCTGLKLKVIGHGQRSWSMCMLNEYMLRHAVNVGWWLWQWIVDVASSSAASPGEAHGLTANLQNVACDDWQWLWLEYSACGSATTFWFLWQRDNSDLYDVTRNLAIAYQRQCSSSVQLYTTENQLLERDRATKRCKHSI